MKQVPFFIMTVIAALVIMFSVTFVPVCAETPDPFATPLPLMSPVPPDKMLKPEVGIGLVPFGASVSDVEAVFGRGELIPEETSGLQVSSLLNLMYPEKGLLFTFSNGLLLQVVVKRPGYATESGVQVGSIVGDFIREMGHEYEIERSLLQIPEPGKEEYQIFYKAASAAVRGKIITEIRIRTTKKLKPPRRK